MKIDFELNIFQILSQLAFLTNKEMIRGAGPGFG